jgi:hypothetical protein
MRMRETKNTLRINRVILRCLSASGSLVVVLIPIHEDLGLNLGPETEILRFLPLLPSRQMMGWYIEICHGFPGPFYSIIHNHPVIRRYITYAINKSS